jgi:hypothetical protein
MLGSITGHQVLTGPNGEAIYVDPPVRGDVVDVDEDTAASWLRAGMAEAAEDAPAAEAPVETAAVDTTGKRRGGS